MTPRAALRRAAVLLLAAAVFLPACGSMDIPGVRLPGGAVYDERVYPGTPDEAFDVIVRASRDMGFHPSELRRPEYLRTFWVRQLAMGKGEGHQTQLEVELEPAEQGGTLVRVRAHRQVNDEGHKPLDLNEARWREAGNDEALEAEMHRRLDIHFRRNEFGPSDELRDRIRAAERDPVAEAREDDARAAVPERDRHPLTWEAWPGTLWRRR